MTCNPSQKVWSFSECQIWLMLFWFSISGAVSFLLWPGFGVSGMSRGQITPELVTRDPSKEQASLSEAFDVFFCSLLVGLSGLGEWAFHVHLFFSVMKPQPQAEIQAWESWFFHLCIILVFVSTSKNIILTDSSRLMALLQGNSQFPGNSLSSLLWCWFSELSQSLPYSLSKTNTLYSNQANTMARLQLQLKTYYVECVYSYSLHMVDKQPSAFP